MSPSGRAGPGAAALLAATGLVACATELRPSISVSPAQSPAAVSSATPPRGAPPPFSPTTLAFQRIGRTFPAIASLISSGERLYWASDGSVWRFSPDEAEPELAYENPADGALIWDIAATDAAFVFAEELARPAGAWRVMYVAREGAAPVEIDRGRAERGRPPTLDIDDHRIAWAGFDESTGAPRTFLRSTDRSELAAPTTHLDVEIEDRLLWYPELDGNALWYSTIDPDFEASGEGDAVHIEVLDLANPSAAASLFEGSWRDFEPAVSVDYVAWKSVGPGLSALTWGAIHVLDRRSNDRLVIPRQADHPSLGSRFVAFEEFFHDKVVLYDLSARSEFELDPPHGSRGTVGVPTVAGDLFAYSVSRKGEITLYWARLPA